MKRAMLLVVAMVLAAGMVLAACTTPTTTVTTTVTPNTETDGTLMPEDIMPVIVLQGDWYEMGYQYGQQARQYVEIRAQNKWGDHFGSGLSEETVVESLELCESYIPAEIDYVKDMMQGMADGASDAGYDVEYMDVLMLNYYWVHIPAHEFEPSCSSWSAWGSATADGSLIAGAACDNWIQETSLAVVAFPEDGYSYIGSCLAGELIDMPCINSQGVFIGSGGGFANSDDQHDAAGVAVHFMDLHVLTQYDNALDAAAWMDTLQWPASENQHVADVHGHAAVVERSAAMGIDPGIIRLPEDTGGNDFLFRTNNYQHPDAEWMFADPKEYIAGIGWVSYASTGGATQRSLPRNKELWTFFNQI